MTVVTAEQVASATQLLKSIAGMQPPAPQAPLHVPAPAPVVPQAHIIPAPAPVPAPGGQVDVGAWLEGHVQKSTHDNQVLLAAVSEQKENVGWAVGQIAKGLEAVQTINNAAVGEQTKVSAERFDALTAAMGSLAKSMDRNTQLLEQIAAVPQSAPQGHVHNQGQPNYQQPQQQPQQNFQRSFNVQQPQQQPQQQQPGFNQSFGVNVEQDAWNPNSYTVDAAQLALEKGGANNMINGPSQAQQPHVVPPPQMGPQVNNMAPNGGGMQSWSPQQLVKSMDSLALIPGSGVTIDDVQNVENQMHNSPNAPVISQTVAAALQANFG